MGQNSQEVSYGFGQLGSVHCKTATPIIPPKGKIICAIQFLANNTPTILRSEDTASTTHGGVNFISTEQASNWGGVTTSTCDGNNSGTTIDLDALNLNIKAGQYVLLVADSTLLTRDAETPPPVYNGPTTTGSSGTGVFVESYAGGTSVVLSEAITPANTQTLVFLDEHHGHGGEDATAVTYPTGLIIYGRWTEVVPEADADGGVICYFGH